RPAPPRPIQPAPRPATGEHATRPKPPAAPETEEYDHNPATSINLPPQRPE
ncbi:ATPase, partial [Tsukamurella pulmonis]